MELRICPGTSDPAPPANPTLIANDLRWEAARVGCQVFRDAVARLVCEVGPFLPASSCDQLLQTLLRDRIACTLAEVLEGLDSALAIRFEDRRIVDNERYLMLVTDILTGECEEFGWTFGGGQAAALWKLNRLFALAGKGVAA